MKPFHEIRDPIHDFIRVDRDERRVIASEPFQRLRLIHQLSMSHFVYPGASHARFEHSLGVMELAGRVYDEIVKPHKTTKVHAELEELHSEDSQRKWRRVLRIAALCHDMGHFPFSHAAEQLLPDGFGSHEAMSRQIIFSDMMRDVLQNELENPVHPKEVAELAVEPQDGDDPLPVWKAILREIIVSPVFGVDRMDYLLRDSHHAGVAYGRFDHHRLIDTMQVLPGAPAEPDGPEGEPTLGVEEGGLHSAEALLLARFFMFSQVYLHEVRRIYDIHLVDFLGAVLPDGKFPVTVEEHLAWTDVEVMHEMRRAAKDPGHPGYDPARRILCREHFRELYRPRWLIPYSGGVKRREGRQGGRRRRRC